MKSCSKILFAAEPFLRPQQAMLHATDATEVKVIQHHRVKHAVPTIVAQSGPNPLQFCALKSRRSCKEHQAPSCRCRVPFHQRTQTVCCHGSFQLQPCAKTFSLAVILKGIGLLWGAGEQTMYWILPQQYQNGFWKASEQVGINRKK